MKNQNNRKTEAEIEKNNVRSGFKEFGTEEQEWVELALAIGMPYDAVVQSFLKRFPEYQSQAADADAEAHLRKTLRKRIKEANTSRRRPSYDRIRDKEAEIELLSAEFGVMNLFPTIAKLQELFDRDDLKPTEYLKVIEAAQRIRKELLGDDGDVSGKSGSIWDKDISEILGDTHLGGKKKDGKA